MPEAPVPDRPNIHSNASPGPKGPCGHADVLIRTMGGEGLGLQRLIQGVTGGTRCFWLARFVPPCFASSPTGTTSTTGHRNDRSKLNSVSSRGLPPDNFRPVA
jgi:hypothetical protein